MGRNDQSIEIDDIYAERVAHCVWDDLAQETDEINRLHIGIAESGDSRVRNVPRSVEKLIQAKFGLSWTRGSLAAKVRELVAQPVVDRIKSNVGEALARAVSGSFTHLATDMSWNINRFGRAMRLTMKPIAG